MPLQKRVRFEIPVPEWKDLITGNPGRPLADVLRQIYRLGFERMTGRTSTVKEKESVS